MLALINYLQNITYHSCNETNPGPHSHLSFQDLGKTWPLANIHVLSYFNPLILPPPLFFLTEGKIKDKGCWQFKAPKTDVPIPNAVIESLQILSLHT